MSYYVHVCPAEKFDIATQTCTAAGEVWIQDIGMLPPLSSADATLIAAAIGGLWFFGWWIRQLMKLARSA